jgi:hypothetical protein
MKIEVKIEGEAGWKMRGQGAPEDASDEIIVRFFSKLVKDLIRDYRWLEANLPKE